MYYDRAEIQKSSEDIFKIFESIKIILNDIIIVGISEILVDESYQTRLIELVAKLEEFKISFLSNMIRGFIKDIKENSERDNFTTEVKHKISKLLLKIIISLRMFERVLSLELTKNNISLALKEGLEGPNKVSGAIKGAVGKKKPHVKNKDKGKGDTIEPSYLEEISRLSEETMNYIELMIFNGLNLVSQENIRQIEMFLQQSSKHNLYRLAVSLRYLDTEIKRFLKTPDLFSRERYILFLANSWNLSNGLISLNKRLSEKSINSDDFNYYMSKIKGTKEKPEEVEDSSFAIVGLENVFQENSILGVILYLLTLNRKNQGSIVKWNIFRSASGVFSTDVILQEPIPSRRKITLRRLLGTRFHIKNFQYYKSINVLNIIKKRPEPKEEDKFTSINIIAEKKTKVQKKIDGSEEETSDKLSKQGENTGNNTKDTVNDSSSSGSEMKTLSTILKLKPKELEYLKANHLFTLKRIYSLISEKDTSPFDLPKESIGEFLVEECQILKYKKQENKLLKIKEHVFIISNKTNFNLKIIISEKPHYKILIRNLKNFFKNKTTLKYLFGKVWVELGEITFTPLSVIDEENNLLYIALEDLNL
ncbi:MAG: hypothetical protein ACTSU2_15570 [Promethearchaeota archaeon]